MTREEAIKIINCYDIGFYDLSGAKIPADKLADAFDMAIEALQREIPKNPVVNFVSDADGSRRLDEGWTEDALLCPVCHTWFGEVFDEGYCRRCGQKIVQKRVKVVV